MTEAVLEISNVLSHLLDKTGISEAALGREIGVPRATINRIVSGRTPDPRASTLKAIAKYFNVTIDQLLGKQPLLGNTAQSVKSNTHNVSIPIIAWNNINNLEATLKSIKPDNHFNWILTDPNIDGGQFGIKVNGESMWPQFQENTILIIDPIKEPKNRDFVIAYTKKSDEVLFRQLVIEGKYKFIKAINEIFPTIQLEEGDRVLGVVIQTRNNFD